jgi:hypothetical protein
VVRIVGPGEAEKQYTARGSTMFFKALAEQADSDLSVMERTLPARGRRPPAHRHTTARRRTSSSTDWSRSWPATKSCRSAPKDSS